MKDQYLGDLNDFAKYQLLRAAGAVVEEVIVAWMLTAPDGGGDGTKIAYLSQPAWREEDPELYDGLATLVVGGERSVAAMAAATLLPSASFEANLVPSTLAARADYFKALAARTSDETLVFLDPDNGIEVKSVAKRQPGAEKYVYWDELRLMAADGAGLAIYQHFPRVKRVPYLEVLMRRLASELGSERAVFAAHTSHVGFLFAVREPLAKKLRAAVAARCEGSRLLSFVELS